MVIAKENRLALRFAVLAAALVASLALALFKANGQDAKAWSKMKADVNLFVANDLGRNGYYQQRPIAELMGNMAEEIGPECVLAVGDVHHFNGVVSVDDPLWTSNYESIYAHPELMIDWLPVLGNHEYRGNTQAVLDYAQRSRRWVMPARYYSRVYENDGTTVRVVMIDTTPLIEKYRNDSITYPDACKQNNDAQLQWLDATLKAAREDWVIVLGHHPVYAQTSKSDSERADMQRVLLPVLHRYGNVAMYVCGHIHNFQHLRMAGDAIDYVVNSAGSLSRKVKAVEGTQFCSPEAGFSVISANKNSLALYMIDGKGVAINKVEHRK
ncbi:MAG: metallophosphoesterase [Muribaculaceae bacterium]